MSNQLSYSKKTAGKGVQVSCLPISYWFVVSDRPILFTLIISQMTTKKAKKKFDYWKDVQQTFEVEQPHQVKLSLLWYWVKWIAASHGADARQLKAHNKTWKSAEQKEKETYALMRKLKIKGGENTFR